jgi:hypothetical protein
MDQSISGRLVLRLVTPTLDKAPVKTRSDVIAIEKQIER